MDLISDYYSKDELLSNNVHSYTNNTNILIKLDYILHVIFILFICCFIYLLYLNLY